MNPAVAMREKLRRDRVKFLAPEAVLDAWADFCAVRGLKYEPPDLPQTDAEKLSDMLRAGDAVFVRLPAGVRLLDGEPKKVEGAWLLLFPRSAYPEFATRRVQ